MAWAERVLVWAAWQLGILFFAFLLYVNLFSEYGVYHNEILGALAAIDFLVLAVWVGTVLPIREWRARRNGGTE